MSRQCPIVTDQRNLVFLHFPWGPPCVMGRHNDCIRTDRVSYSGMTAVTSFVVVPSRFPLVRNRSRTNHLHQSVIREGSLPGSNPLTFLRLDVPHSCRRLFPNRESVGRLTRIPGCHRSHPSMPAVAVPAGGCVTDRSHRNPSTSLC